MKLYQRKTTRIRIIASVILEWTGTFSIASAYTIIVNPPSGYTDLMDVVNAIANYVYLIAIPIAVIMIVYGGVRFLMARGNPGEVTKAKQILLWAMVGLAVIFINTGFVYLVKAILGIP